MEPMFIIVPFEAIKRGAKPWVTDMSPNTFTSYSFFASEIGASSNGRLSPVPMLICGGKHVI
jgi:hypothetical protein